MELKYKDEFFKQLKKIDKSAFLKKMTNEAGVIAVNFSKERFIYKNWLDKRRQPWKTNKKRKRKGRELVKTGRLKRSIKKLAEGNYYVYIGTDVPYAKIHNEGGTITETVSVKSHTRKRSIKSRQRNPKTNRMRNVTTKTEQKVRAHKRKMNTKIPARQFLGSSVFLARKIERHMAKQINEELKKR